MLLPSAKKSFLLDTILVRPWPPILKTRPSGPRPFGGKSFGFSFHDVFVEGKKKEENTI
jgi:hypothetical protein